MSGSYARRKGHSFERDIANRLKALDPTARRNVTETQEGSFDITTELPLAIQCKSLGRWSLTPHVIWEQAHMHAKGRMPVGVVKITHKAPELVILAWDDFYKMIESIHEHHLWRQLRSIEDSAK